MLQRDRSVVLTPRSAARLRAAVGLAAAVLGLAACSNADQDQTVGAGPATGPGASPTSTPTAAPSESSATPAATNGPKDAGTALITFRLPDCVGCKVTVYSALEKREPRTWVTPAVRDGMTSVAVPRSLTPGMAFEVERPDGLGLDHSRSVVVLAYKGVPPGTTVDTAQVDEATSANWCWSGTTGDAATISVKQRIAGSGDDRSVIYWASPGLSARAGQWQPPVLGGLGHQDAPWCGPAAADSE